MRKVKIKAKMKYLYTTNRIANDRQNNASIGEGAEQLEFSCTSGGAVNVCNHLKKLFGSIE